MDHDQPVTRKRTVCDLIILAWLLPWSSPGRWPRSRMGLRVMDEIIIPEDARRQLEHGAGAMAESYDLTPQELGSVLARQVPTADWDFEAPGRCLRQVLCRASGSVSDEILRGAVAAIALSFPASGRPVRLPQSVRYRYDETLCKRYTTVELIVAESAWAPRRRKPRSTRSPDDMVYVRVGYGEEGLRAILKALGAL